MESFTTFVAEFALPKGEGRYMRDTAFPVPPPPMFKPVIQGWLAQHNRCGVCMGVRAVRQAWDSVIWKSEASEGKFI